MSEKPQTNESAKNSGADATRFDVAEEWPLPRVAQRFKEKAVEALVANHTLIVGQSRSGKTNAARRLIEQVLRWTDARVVILDPNADFKLLGQIDPQVDRAVAGNAEFADQWTTLGKQIEVARPNGPSWGIKWSELSKVEMAAFLRLTPTDHFAEYRHFDRHLKYELETVGLSTLEKFKESRYFQVAVGEELERYRLRLEQVSKLDVWYTSDAQKDLDSLFESKNKAIVVDLSMDDEQVRMITAARTLQALWKQGEERRKEFLQGGNASWTGTLVLIDEGHLFAPPHSEDPQKRLVCERIQRFADQGKKLNLYLLTITQQPGKLHPDVLSEFNSRIILRVNERRSLKVLEETYGGFRGRYDGALTFVPGEALIEGALLCDESPLPTVPRAIYFKKALTLEGGGTPKTDWARPKSPTR